MPKKVTHEEFLQKCKKNNNVLDKIEILGKYVNSLAKIKCKCKVHNIEYEATPHSILYGNGGCPKCAIEKVAKKRTKTFEDFLKRFKENNENYNNIEILGEYINLHTSLLCKCKIHNIEWSPIPDNLIYGTGCPLCGNEKIGNKLRKSEEKFDEELYELFPNIKRIGKYVNDVTSIEFYCNDCNSTFFSTPSSILHKKQGCSFCSKGLSFPNKVGRNLLFSLLGNNFDFEWHPKWIEPYRYDLHFFYNNKEYIIELDGGYHKNLDKLKIKINK